MLRQHCISQSSFFHRIAATSQVVFPAANVAAAGAAAAYLHRIEPGGDIAVAFMRWQEDQERARGLLARFDEAHAEGDQVRHGFL